MSEKKTSDNVYRCACGASWPAPGAGSSCEACGREAALCCGARPNGRNERDHPCFRRVPRLGTRCHFHGGKSPKGPASPA